MGMVIPSPPTLRMQAPGDEKPADLPWPCRLAVCSMETAGYAAFIIPHPYNLSDQAAGYRESDPPVVL